MKEMRENVGDRLGGWARAEDKPAEHLEKMLSVALTNFAKQTDWFLHHYDSGIKHVGLVLTAQVSMTSIALSSKVVPPWLAIATLLFLGVVGSFFAVSAIYSARRSYSASIEYAVLTTKSLWALGLTGIIGVPKSWIDTQKPPAPDDGVFYIDRHVKNHTGPEKTTENVVKDVLKSRSNTFYCARCVLAVFGFAAVALAIAGSIAVLAKISSGQ